MEGGAGQAEQDVFAGHQRGHQALPQEVFGGIGIDHVAHGGNRHGRQGGDSNIKGHGCLLQLVDESVEGGEAIVEHVLLVQELSALPRKGGRQGEVIGRPCAQCDHLGNGESRIPQPDDLFGDGELGWPVVAIAGERVDPGRDEEPVLGVMPQHAHTHPGQPGEHPDLEQVWLIHVDSRHPHIVAESRRRRPVAVGCA